MRRLLALAAFLALAAAAQTLRFDVASVKPATPPPGVTISGDSTMAPRGVQIPRAVSDPGRIHYPLITLRGLLSRAFPSALEIKSPEFADSVILEVDATMPPTTTRDQLQQMLRTLLADRFHFTFHTDTKEISGYALVIAKSGSKLKPAADAPPPSEQKEESGRGSRAMDAEGFPIPPATLNGIMIQSMPVARARMVGRHATAAQLVDSLTTLLRTRIEDATGLSDAAKYDFTLTYAGGLGGPGPYYAAETGSEADGVSDIFSALQSQLGLKLEPRKITAPIVVVDHLDRAPTAN